MHVAIYVAIAENGVIGRDGGLPWRLSTDLKRFKADTDGQAHASWAARPGRALPPGPCRAG